ncbi:uncharacterized protein LOC130706333 [Balaenoptera acutorostrata]|uniref:Uncharacterized protein LOC130706333 n=1 Tax=Balaenoptera acutorostrata TaxID=9767 RepID=A0ABM3SV19_BALAC|nr:uncharacterized protein LOC130706333 [Balaenoptera acutorostrata]
MANSLHRITAAPAPAPLSITYAPRGQAAPPRTLPHYIPPYTLPHPPPAGVPLWALQAGRPPMRKRSDCLSHLPIPGSPPPSTLRARGSRLTHPSCRAHPLALTHPGAGAPFLPRASSPHPSHRPGGSSHNAYRARARKSSPSTRACARSSSAFFPPHAAALSPRLVSRPGEGARESSPSTRTCARSSSAFLPPHAAAVSPRFVSRPEEEEWPTRSVLPTPTASRPLLWPPKPAPPAQQEALRSGPSPTTSPHTPSPTHHLLVLRSGPWKLGAPPMRRDQTASLTSPQRGVPPPEHPQSQGLSSLTSQMQTPSVLPPPTWEPEPPFCHECPPLHPTPRPGGNSHNVYLARARDSSPSTRASARSSSAFFPPHAAAFSPCLVSRPEEGAQESSPSTRACTRNSSAFPPATRSSH